MAWPGFDTAWPKATLAAYKGDTFLYVGEGAGGCTADHEFHELLEKEFDPTNAINIPQFFGLHDRLEIWKR
jgi:hypothetical protein